MLPFHTFLLRTHFAQTRWDEDAFFSALTRPTAGASARPCLPLARRRAQPEPDLTLLPADEQPSSTSAYRTG